MIKRRWIRALAALCVVIGSTGIWRLEAQNDSLAPLLKEFSWRAIGPATLGGRVDDIEVVESNTHNVYVGVAEGGVWKSENEGTTWLPVFDTQPSYLQEHSGLSRASCRHPASTSTATVFTGANASATRHARIRREKLSITACT